MHPFTNKFLLDTFGRPRGFLGRLGGVIMARGNRDCAAWVVGLLEIKPAEKVLELGFGPGVGIELLARSAAEGYVAGVDPSGEMVRQATRRNAMAIESGRIDLRVGSAESLPFDPDVFDKAMAINSLQLWPDAIAGLRELRRVMKSGGRLALGFTRYSGQQKAGLAEIVAMAGFTGVDLLERERDFCEMATKP